MFWRRKKKTVQNIEGALWRYMVSQQHVASDVLQNLRLVERDVVIGGKPIQLTMIRIFHPAAAKKKGVTIDDYESLDSYPELIRYQGFYETADGEVTNIRIEKQPERLPDS